MLISEVGRDYGSCHSMGCGCKAGGKCCLECCLMACKHDAEGSEAIQAHRRGIILRLKEEGKTPDEIADALEISKRTVFRTLHDGVRS